MHRIADVLPLALNLAIDEAETILDPLRDFGSRRERSDNLPGLVDHETLLSRRADAYVEVPAHAACAR